MSRKKKILLVSPDMERYSQPRMGILYIGTALIRTGQEVKIITINERKIDLLRNTLLNFKPDWVGATAFSSQHVFVMDIFKVTKEINPGTFTVFGGPHASALPEYLLKNNIYIDFIIKGEGEESIVELVSNNKKYSEISGLVYRDGNKIIVNGSEIISDLESLGYPFLIADKYEYRKSKVHGYMCKHKPVVPVFRPVDVRICVHTVQK
ncbi:unnamed protein product, partial [marine sediment metagenome]